MKLGGAQLKNNEMLFSYPKGWAFFCMQLWLFFKYALSCFQAISTT